METWIFVAVFFGIACAVFFFMLRGELVGSLRCERYSLIGSGGAGIAVRRVGRESGNPTVQLQLTMFGAMRGAVLKPADALRLAQLLEEAAHKWRAP